MSYIDEQSLKVFLEEIYKYPLLTAEEERELIRRAKKGDIEARNKLINSNLRYIYKMAKKYSGMGIPISDLINEGVLGLIKAIDKYDLKRRVRLLTYATSWIRQAMMKALTEQSRAIKLNSSIKGKLDKVRRAMEDYYQRYQREPSEEELAQITGMSIDEVKEVLNIYKGQFSIDELIGDDNGRTIEETFPDPFEEEIEEKIKKEERINRFMEILERELNERERKIIVEYYGLHLKEPKTLEQIGKELGISRERVRQIKERALRKLKFKYGHLLKAII